MYRMVQLYPVKGVYAESEIERGVMVRVWSVDPNTGEKGTSIEYRKALKAVATFPGVFMALPIKKDGKLVSPFDNANVPSAEDVIESNVPSAEDVIESNVQ